MSNLIFKAMSVLLWIFVVGVLVVSVARELSRPKPSPGPVKILNSNESYRFPNERKTR